ncbi:MAG TPA: hypothetical protein VKT78_14660, partial [Fimbriimonadaceae bacterium]|nr:hypothetical protein [Fimbriimonadaceae bacterium]
LTRSIVFDTGVYLGECLRVAAPTLKWSLSMRSKSSVDYGEVVLGPFGRTSINMFGICAVLAMRALEQGPAEDALIKMFDYWRARVASAETAKPA